MRVGALPALVLLGASLAAASPIRVVVAEVSSTGGARYGHAAAQVFPAVMPTEPTVDNAAPHPVIAVKSNSIYGNATGDRKGHGRHLCQSMRAKALEASNFLRQILGLEPIITNGPGGPTIIAHIHHAPQDAQKEEMMMMRILPFIGTPVRPAFVVDGENQPGWHHRGGEDDQMMRAYRHFHRLHGSFLRRVHHALMALGPWEGRAVAFVLGCGIGVLLRMFWVMVLVAARAFHGSREGEEEYTIVFDEAEMLVPPPQYTTIQDGEAVAVVIDEKPEKEPVAA